MIESSQKKTVFLREALSAVDRKATIMARRFEEIEAPEVAFVTCRALDRFIRKLPALKAWAPDGATLLLFGGEELRKKIPDAEACLMPRSERRYLLRGDKSR